MYQLPPISEPLDFPADFRTTTEGLLAIGGNLHPTTLVNAYSKGIFPWFSEEEPILWWHPYPRAVLFPKTEHISRKMSLLMKKTSFLGAVSQTSPLPAPSDDSLYTVTIDRDFSGVITECAQKRTKDRESTWITKRMKEAYTKLYDLKFAHSVEVWNNNHDLVGGMYGIAIGKVFFGESMFSHESNTSKLALFFLAQHLATLDYILIDCQVDSKHLQSLGATNISRKKFMEYLKKGKTHLKKPGII